MSHVNISAGAFSASSFILIAVRVIGMASSVRITPKIKLFVVISLCLRNSKTIWKSLTAALIWKRIDVVLK